MAAARNFKFGGRINTGLPTFRK